MKAANEDIPEDWSLKSLNNIAEINMGQSPPSSSYNEDGDGILLVQGNADIKNRVTKPRFYTKSPTKISKPNSLIMTVRAPVGLISKNFYKICIGRGVCSIIALKANQEYLYQFLIEYENSWSSIQQGSTFTAVNSKDVKSIKISLPPLPEQQKIVDILSTVDAKITMINQQIAATEELKKGLMQRLLTKGIGHTEFKDSPLGEIPKSWEVKKLGELLNNIKGGGTPSKDVSEYWKPEIPWVTVKDLKKLILDDSIDYISKVGLENSAANLIPAWTLIISTRMAVGKAVFVTKDVTINQDLKALFPKGNLNKFFLFHWFSCNSESILNLASGSTVKGIRLEILKGLKLALPPIEEQLEIANILDSMDSKLNIQHSKSKTYQQLKKGLMQQLLTGKVRVKA